MGTTIFLGVVAVGLTLPYRLIKFKWHLIAALTCIFLFLALRYEFGNDYISYRDSFSELLNKNGQDYFYFRGYEYGWLYLNKAFALMGPNGFYVMVAALALANVVALYRVCCEYMPVKYAWLFFFCYVFSPYSMLVMASAMRQQVALTIFLWSIVYLTRGQILRYTLGILVATLFHNSAIVLLLLIAVRLGSRLSVRLSVVAAVLLVIVSFEFGAEIGEYVLQAFMLDIYANYADLITASDTGGIGLGVVAKVLIAGWVVVATWGKLKGSENIFIIIYLFDLVLISLSFYSPLITRIGFYFLPLAPVAYSLAAEHGPSRIMGPPFLGLVVLLTLYEFRVFFESEVWRPHFFEFTSLLSLM